MYALLTFPTIPCLVKTKVRLSKLNHIITTALLMVLPVKRSIEYIKMEIILIITMRNVPFVCSL